MLTGLPSGNRFGPVEEGLKFEGVEELHLNDTLLPWEQVSGIYLAVESVSLT